MKIRIAMTVEIPDPEQWTLAYGVEGAAAIREDVRDYLFTEVAQAPAWDEVDATVIFH